MCACSLERKHVEGYFQNPPRRRAAHQSALAKTFGTRRGKAKSNNIKNLDTRSSFEALALARRENTQHTSHLTPMLSCPVLQAGQVRGSARRAGSSGTAAPAANARTGPRTSNSAGSCKCSMGPGSKAGRVEGWQERNRKKKKKNNQRSKHTRYTIHYSHY